MWGSPSRHRDRQRLRNASCWSHHTEGVADLGRGVRGRQSPRRPALQGPGQPGSAWQVDDPACGGPSFLYEGSLTPTAQPVLRASQEMKWGPREQSFSVAKIGI